MMTGSEGVSFRLPQLFLSQHRLQAKANKRIELEVTVEGVRLHGELDIGK